MALTNPQVSVRDVDNFENVSDHITMPTVMSCGIRPDVVRIAHIHISRNSRQPYAVSLNSGYQTSAQSWGTGRAVARIPRVAGGGTHRAGQGAFGNMCRDGGMFAPTKVWRRWHRSTNLTMRRHAVASAIAATAVPALVMARGHRIEDVHEIPMVVSSKFESLKKTQEVVEAFKNMGASDELVKVKDSKAMRSGKGKARNRRYTMRRGPLIVYGTDGGITKASRNIPGVDSCDVEKLSLLELAPGGHLGRFVVWTEDAFKRLQEIYGTYETGGVKKGYTLPRPMMSNGDLDRIINSDEIQRALRPAIQGTEKAEKNQNPLRNKDAKARLNPLYEERHHKRSFKGEVSPTKKSKK
eukprot:GHVO01005868.1.p1 GENE.GHVO01005868.1~~GHVO01005868.1.p1  ORF type:complete len:366 (+),score=54.59 GHVO01005868.1:37-1098(+)